MNKKHRHHHKKALAAPVVFEASISSVSSVKENRWPRLQLTKDRSYFFVLLFALAIIFGIVIEEFHKTAGALVVANARESILQTRPSPSPSPLPISAEQPVPILMYHYIREYTRSNDRVGRNLSVSPQHFAAQLSALKAAGYTTITLNDIGKPLPEKPIILTFDDGYSDAFTAALPALQKEQMRGVFYVVNEFVGKSRYVNSEQLKALDAAGMEIGSHTINHHYLSKMGESEQRKQLLDSKAALETLLGKPVTALCYPAGRYNETTKTLAKEIGYTSATTVKPGVAKYNDFSESPYDLVRIRVTNDTDILKEIARHGR